MTRTALSAVLLSFICSAAFSQRVTAVVEAEKRGKPINPLLYGVNTARWDESLFPGPAGDMLLTADRDALMKIRASGVTLLKYPGGNDADSYIWNDPTNNATEMDTDEYIALCRQVGAEPFITINFNASPELAASWVRYCNRERGYDVKLWEVGDEQWGTWAKGHAPPEVYAQKYKRFVDAMRAVDPTIKVATNVPLGPHPENWTTRVLTAAADHVDMLTFTFFPQKWGEENDDSLLASVGQFRRLYSELYREVTDVVGEERAKEIMFVNVGYNSVNHSPGPQTLELVNAIWTADMLGSMASLGVDVGCFWALHNAFPPRKGDYGILSSEGSNTPSPSYYVFPMFSRHLRGDFLPSSTSDPMVHSYASREGSRVAVALVNRDKMTAKELELMFRGFDPGQEAHAWVLDRSHGYEPLEVPPVTDGHVAITLPAFSVVIVEVISSDAALPPVNLARSAIVSASSTSSIGPHFGPEMATDGLRYTRWNSAAWTKSQGDEAQWIRLDWDSPKDFSRIVIYWGRTRAVDYSLDVSADGRSWRTASEVNGGKGSADTLTVSTTNVKSLRVNGRKGSPGISAYSIRELEVY